MVVSRRFPTAAVHLSQVRLRGICCGESGTGAGFLRVPGFLLPILIPPSTLYKSINRGWYNGPNNDLRAKGTLLTPPAE
jgi:hypothetical protein